MNAEKPKNGKKTGFRGPSPDVGKATQFQPGNPGGGRPKSKPISDALLAALGDPSELKKIITAIIKEAKDGNVKAFTEIRDTVEGKPIQQLDVKGEIKGTVILSSVPRPQRTA